MSSQPLLRIVRGDPTPEELAALVAVLAARQAAVVASGKSARRTRPSGWTNRAVLMRRPLRPGPGAWRRAALPR